MKSYFNWSGGKDSALALYYVLKEGKYQVDRLITTINASTDRVSMHGVSADLTAAQVSCMGLPWDPIHLPPSPSMDEYDKLMEKTVSSLKSEHFTHSIFGDIYLEDLKKYREEKLSNLGMKAVFPLWKRDTRALLEAFWELDFQAIIVSVNGSKMESSFAGRLLDEAFLDDLPKDVDPCGENGEFHTFVFDGPIFDKPVPFKKGQIVRRTYPDPTPSSNSDLEFYFCDLLPVVP